jgi:hypothetical protein
MQSDDDFTAAIVPISDVAVGETGSFARKPSADGFADHDGSIGLIT